MSEIVEFFENIFNTKEKLLNADKLIIKKIHESNEFLIKAVTTFVKTKEEKTIRKHIGVTMKNILFIYWDTDPIIEQNKNKLRVLLLNGVVLNAHHLDVINVNATIIAGLIVRDGIKKWRQLLEPMITWMNSNKEHFVQAGLDSFCVIFEKSDDRIHILVPKMMKALYQMFTRDDVSEETREKILMMLYLCFSKISWAEGVDDQILSNCLEQTYNVWIGLFSSIMSTSPQNMIGLKIQITKILCVIFRDIKSYAATSINTFVFTIFKSLKSYLNLYVWVEVGGKMISDDPDFESLDDANNMRPKYGGFSMKGFTFDEDDHLSTRIYGVALHLLELTSILMFESQLSGIISYGMIPLTKIICNYLLMRKEEEQMWVEDSNHYLANDEDEHDNSSLRNLALSVFSNLIERFDEDAIESIMVLIDHLIFGGKGKDMKQMFFNLLKSVPPFMKQQLKEFDLEGLFNFDIYEEFGRKESLLWKRREMALFLLGSFSQDIIVSQIRRNGEGSVDSLIKALIDSLQNEKNPMIIGRCLWTIGRISSCVDNQNIESTILSFMVAVHFVANEHQSIKLMAAKTMSSSANKLIRSEKKEELRARMVKEQANINEIYKAIVNLAEETNESTVHIILACIITLCKIYPELLLQTTKNLSKDLLMIFGNQYSDPLIAGYILDLIVMILEDGECGKFFIPIFVPNMCIVVEELACERLNSHRTLTFAEEENRISFLASLIDILVLALRKSGPNGYDLPLLFRPFSIVTDIILKSSNPISVIKSTVCLKSYLLYTIDYVLENKLMKPVFAVLDKLLNVKELEILSQYVGNLVMVITEKLPSNKEGNIELMKRLLTKLQKCVLPSTVQGISLYFSRLINKSAMELINLLGGITVRNRVGLKVLLDRWLLHQPKFIGNLTKNTTYKALMILFQTMHPQLEMLLVIGFDPSHSQRSPEVTTPLKILSILIRCLDNELKVENQLKGLNSQALAEQYRVEMANYDDNERLETIDDDDEEYYNMDFKDEDSLGDDMEVNLHIQPDFEDLQDDDEYNKMGINGFQNIETSSQSFLSGMLGFDEFDSGECDETTEEDLRILKDQNLEFDLVDTLKQFIQNMVNKNEGYMKKCFSGLCKSDREVLKKRFEFDHLL